jgi:hypothetical protein
MTESGKDPNTTSGRTVVLGLLAIVIVLAVLAFALA